MIEIIQETEKTEDKQEAKLPRNIRQIGNPEKDFRIYMEDYVYTYLHPAQLYGCEIGVFPRMLILVGEIEHFSNRSCAFISGAVQVENERFPEEVPELNDAAWRRVKKEMQQFFDKCQIVGWVLDIPGNALEITPEIEDMHRTNFLNNFQFFFLMDSKEREEAFYTWKEGRLTRKEGYFIYYEKNPQMQEYMISRRQEHFGEHPPIEDVDDEAARTYRAMMMERKENSFKRHSRIFSYAISSLMVVALCSVTVLLIGYIRRMDHMEETLTVMSVAMESTEQERVSQPGEVAVETISSNIVPAEDIQGEVQQDPGDIMAEGQPENVLPEPSGSALAGEQQPENQEETNVSATEEPKDETESSYEEETPPVLTEAQVCLQQGYYIVKAGDSLEKVCFKIYGNYDKLEEICRLNGIENQNTIFAGQKITLP
ncbi:LysM peptidoglycan-binding domain-containing protein [Roseburia sp. 1XD42-69]|uniref:LysM peptidoglycan-binding domain-containing protein n=1 Tax=Roseburia sp. 1XD42-69 TaxID=2320088 RepID=UPI000EA40503|nr:LysM domain-containing protein [Roseburia sp. 1XD42-69]RKJ62889.1 LysM domain-containing protein [Roseburia sp. 1XD42-69]